MNTNKQQFIISQIKPYFLNPNLVSLSKLKRGSYYNHQGKTCVIGGMLKDPKSFANVVGGIRDLLKLQTQTEIFKPQFVGVLTPTELHLLQRIHDYLPRNNSRATANQITKSEPLLNSIYALARQAKVDLSELLNLLK